MYKTIAICSALSLTLSACAPAPTTPLTDSDVASEQAELPERQDTWAIAALIYDDAMTEEEFLGYAFTDAEVRELMIAVGVLDGADEQELREMLEAGPVDPMPGPTPPWGACTQSVERGSGSATAPYTYWSSTWCDGDGSDQDWVFAFSPSGATDPDDLRWSANWWVESVFNTAYGGRLLGSSLCTSPQQICLGTNGVSMAGGAGYVRQKLRLRH